MSVALWKCIALLGVGLAWSSCEGERKEPALLVVGERCESGLQCYSAYCETTRRTAERVCCATECSGGQVCQLGGTACESPLVSESPSDSASSTATPPMGSGPNAAGGAPGLSSTAGGGAASTALRDAGAGGAEQGTLSDAGGLGARQDAALAATLGTDAAASSVTAAGGSNGVSPSPDTVDVDAALNPDPGSPTASTGSTSPSVPIDADASPAPSMSTPLPECDVELLFNGGFEDGSADWNPSSSWPGTEVIVAAEDSALQAEGVAPQAGAFLAWFGGIEDNEHDGHLVQIEKTFSVPSDASGLQLSGYVWIKTAETELDAAYDTAYVDVLDQQEQLLWLPSYWSNLDASTGWVAFSEQLLGNDLDRLRGQTVVLRIHSETDPEMKTSFWLDSLSLVATCGR
jgi:hypothetical protein